MTDSIQLELEIPDTLRGRRLDQALAELVQDYSRSRLQQWIRAGQVTVDARVARVRETVQGGERVCIDAEIARQTEKRFPNNFSSYEKLLERVYRLMILYAGAD